MLEALRDRSLRIEKVLLSRDARGGLIEELLAAAQARNIPVTRVDARAVSRVSRSPSQDQGVVADVYANMVRAEAYFEEHANSEHLQIIAFDGVTTPANIGLSIRSAAAAGVSAVLLPSHGASGLNPLVVKASAGLVFRIPIIKCTHLEDALQAASSRGIAILGLEADAEDTLYQAQLPPRAIYVLGNETFGLSPNTRPFISKFISIPMAPGVESMNVATAATLVSFEGVRRRNCGG